MENDLGFFRPQESNCLYHMLGIKHDRFIADR